MDRLNRSLLAFFFVLTFVPSGASAVTLDLVEVFAIGDFVDGSFDEFEAELVIEETGGDPNPITAVSYTAPGGQSGSLLGGGGVWEQDVALTGYGDAVGLWAFEITDSLSNVITFSLNFAQAQPTSLPDLTSHANGDTLNANPTFTWTCVSCAGAGSIEAYLINETTDMDVYEQSFAVGGNSWTPGVIDPTNEHSLELELLNQVTISGVSVAGINGSFDYIAAGSNINTVFFSPTTPVPEPGTAFLLGFGMLGLTVQGRRRRALR